MGAAAADSAALPPSPLFSRLATLVFGLAILHTFLASRFMRIAHRFEREHHERGGGDSVVSFKAEVFHFLGEIEVVFGLWVLPLFATMIWFHGWEISVSYLNGLKFTEPLFVLVIMTIASTRPILSFAQNAMATLANIGRASAAAWWLSILTIGPILGSFITEPAAMTISALLLSGKFFSRGPSKRLAYATF